MFQFTRVHFGLTHTRTEGGSCFGTSHACVRGSVCKRRLRRRPWRRRRRGRKRRRPLRRLAGRSRFRLLPNKAVVHFLGRGAGRSFGEGPLLARSLFSRFLNYPSLGRKAARACQAVRPCHERAAATSHASMEPERLNVLGFIKRFRSAVAPCWAVVGRRGES